MSTLPIYRRHIVRAPRPHFVCTEKDQRDAWENIHPTFSFSRARCGFELAKQFHKPKILFIGDSNMHHLSCIQFDTKLFHESREFICELKFVACGGVKWWSAEEELNGVFQSQAKADKYGNQWQQLFDSDVTPDATVLCIGSNDADDFHSHDYWLKMSLCF